MTILVFILSFCSFFAQCVLASKVTILSNGGIFLYPLSIALFILMMGLGCIFFKNKSFYLNEVILIFIFYTYLFSISFIESIGQEISIGYTLMIICAVGFLSGKEIPYFVERFNNENIKKILLIDYISSFIASILFYLFIYPKIGINGSLVLLIIINTIALFFIKKNFFNFLLMISSIIVCSNFKNINKKLYEIKYKGSDILSVVYTDFQEVVLYKHKEYYAVNLNNNIQFYNKISDDDIYHFMLIDPILSFFKYKKVLILGGGDGLPAKQLLKYNFVEKIDMIDIDRNWIDFSKNNEIMKKINNNSLNNKRISVIIDDAFKFVQETKEKYDLILIDFPEADNLAGLRVHSQEFNLDLNRILSPNGVLIIQNDVFYDKKLFNKGRQIIINTMESSGFHTIYSEKRMNFLLKEQITQFYGFKSEKDMSSFLKFKYESKYGQMHYQKGIPSDEGVMTIYEPILLRMRFLNALGVDI